MLRAIPPLPPPILVRINVGSLQITGVPTPTPPPHAVLQQLRVTRWVHRLYPQRYMHTMAYIYSYRTRIVRVCLSSSTYLPPKVLALEPPCTAAGWASPQKAWRGADEAAAADTATALRLASRFIRSASRLRLPRAAGSSVLGRPADSLTGFSELARSLCITTFFEAGGWVDRGGGGGIGIERACWAIYYVWMERTR